MGGTEAGFEGVSLARRSARVLLCRCYAKERKEGSDRPIHLDPEPRCTHIKARDYLQDHASARIYVLFLSFMVLRMQAIDMRLSQKPDQAHMYSCLLLNELKFPEPTNYGRRGSRSNLIRASGIRIETQLCRKKEGLEITTRGVTSWSPFIFQRLFHFAYAVMR